MDFWISTGLVPKLSNVEFGVVSSAYKIKKKFSTAFYYIIDKNIKNQKANDGALWYTHRYRFDMLTYPKEYHG